MREPVEDNEFSEKRHCSGGGPGGQARTLSYFQDVGFYSEWDGKSLVSNLPFH